LENTILSGKTGRNRVKEGIDKTANAIKATLGARGRNAMLISQNGPAHITKDGVTVARSIFLEDPFEKAGSNLVKEVAHQTVLACGDSTTTASILFQEIVSSACKMLDEGNINVNELNRGILRGIGFVSEHIRKKAQPISGNLDLLRKIAIIASNNDEELGGVIAAAVNSVGENGRVSVVESQDGKTTYRIEEGMQYDRGYLAKEFITHPKRNLAVLENPYILISERPLMQMKQLAPILEKVAEANEQSPRPLLVIAPEVDMEALALLVANHKQKVLQICAVQCPGQGMAMEDYTTDLSVYTGATVISEERNIKLESATLEYLGSAVKAEIGPKGTLIIGGGGNPEELETRVESLKSLLEATSNPHEKESLSERISSISCSVAILSIGAGSVTEGREKADRVDDAIKACQAANEEGYVAGSGATYNGACFHIPLKQDQVRAIHGGKTKNSGINDYQRGLYCVHQAIQAISAQIVINAGKPAYGGPWPAEVYDLNYGHGYDAKADEMCNLIERGIIDPAKALRVALQNAGSVATTFLTTEVFSFTR